MGKIEIDHTGSGGGITLSSDGTSLLLGGSAVGGGGGPTFKTFGTSSIMIGDDATGTINNANDNTGLGVDVFAALTSGDKNTAIGRSALQSNTTASNNTAIGEAAGYSNTTGGNNVAIGTDALYSSTTASENTALGQGALQSSTTATNNTAVGYSASQNSTTAIQNVIVGNEAGKQISTGGFNSIVGAHAGGTITTGQRNAFFGRGSGQLVTTGSKNSIIGAYTGNQNSLDIRTSDNNIVLSDGDGNPRLYINSSGTVYFGNHDTIASSGYIDKQTSGVYEFKIHASSSTSTNRAMTFHNRSNTEAMRIDTSGNLLVGTTTYNGPGNASSGDYGVALREEGILTAGANASESLVLNRMNSDGDLATFKRSGSTVGNIASGDSGNEFKWYGAFASGAGLGAYSNVSIRPLSNTGAASDNAVNLGHSSQRFKDLYLSGGVYLGGTGTLNKLDDYEYGSYTVTATPETAGSQTLHAAYRTLTYTKIGRLVKVQGNVYISSNSSAAGSTLFNLPFASSMSEQSKSFSVLGVGSYPTPSSTSLMSASGSMRAYKAGGGPLSAGSWYSIDFTYIVDV